MNERYGRITGWGAYVPEQIVTNFDLEKRMDTSHEWIVKRTGIEARRVAAPDETTATMATKAGAAALDKAGLSAKDLGLIIVATSTPDHLTPPVSSQVQHMLGATDVPAFVLVTGCTGFIYAMSTAQQFVNSGSYDSVLVIGVELLSRHINWQDRSTCVLFGDAAGAVVMESSSEPCGVLAFELGSDGSGAEHIVAPAGGTAEPFNENTFAEGRQYVQMNGREVFRFATQIIGQSCRRVMEKAGEDLEGIEWIIPHQANLRIIQTAARAMDVPLEKFYVNIQQYANTSAASIPLALCEGLESGQIEPHHKLLMVSFGAGLTWATALLQLAPKIKPTSNGQVSLVTANGRMPSMSHVGANLD